MLAQGATMYSVDFTADGAVWLAMEKGLGLYWPGSGRVQPITGGYGAGDMGLLDGYPVNDVQTDPIDSFLLWIGTSGGGLFRLDVRNGSVTEAMAGVIQDGIVYCILPGTAGKLWLSTNFGLYEYDPFSGTHRNFGRRDGLQGAEFNTWASGIRKVRSRDGWSEELMFGGVAGLNHFDPARLQVQHAAFDMNINILEVNEEEIKVGDKSGILSAAVEYLPPVCLPFEKNNIRISYSLTDYSNPAANQFEYYLAGLEQPWVHHTRETNVAYVHLPPGNFVFHVRGRNQDNTLSRNVASLAITILPPWYRTKLAYAAYASVLAILLAYYHRLQVKRRQAEKELVLQQHHMETREREMAHQRQLYERELAAFGERLLERSQFAGSLRDVLDKQGGEAEKEADETLELRRKLHNFSILTNSDWEQFQQLFEKVYPGVIGGILERCPQLTPAEFRFLLLSRLQLNSEKMAMVLGVNTGTIKQTRYRLRKKLSQLSVDSGDLLEDLLRDVGL
jgi:hypothetical protein